MNDLKGFHVRAEDGVLGKIKEFYFDDERWAVRYVVVDTGWTTGAVLISPISVAGLDTVNRDVFLALTKDQIRRSPSPDLHRPVSRQFERDYSDYYGYLPYWGGPKYWAAGDNPSALARETHARPSPTTAAAVADTEQSHLRSSEDVRGHHLRASDGDIGHVDDFLVDEESWAIRYLQVDTSNWIGGRCVLVPQSALGEVSWYQKTIGVRLTREQIRKSPAYDPALLNEGFEQQVEAHYGQ